MLALQKHFEYNLQSKADRERDCREMGMSEEEVASFSQGCDEPFFTTAPEHCFFCGEKLTIPAVVWQGRDSQIWLHPPCAYDLGASLFIDADKHEAEPEKG